VKIMVLNSINTSINRGVNEKKIAISTVSIYLPMEDGFN